jgi:hypothetical protein
VVDVPSVLIVVGWRLEVETRGSHLSRQGEKVFVFADLLAEVGAAFLFSPSYSCPLTLSPLTLFSDGLYPGNIFPQLVLPLASDSGTLLTVPERTRLFL